ncbi:MAG: hypothetical protein PHX87_03475 [Candidatus Peribacteraceae bacterium]|nr:hypothetical protein [Candidatus Peribacteraceae bacterium]MDD5742467.1 hypothetical protein [Candidatus Peribacteraceae bacterium]
MTFSLRTALSGVAASLLLLVASQVHASGAVTIIQQSPVGMFGDYTITFPLGSQVTINEQEFKELPVAEIGTYLLHISPPSDAKMTTTVTKNGIDLIATTDRDVRFTLADLDEVTVTIKYRYDGTIIVDSDPEGASFELLGPNNARDTGFSPATYTGMPPGAYRVTFHRRAGCNLVSPIQRSLNANATLTLFGRFACGVTSSSSSSSSSVTPEEPIADTNEGRMVRIWVAANQAEALAGSIVRTTITVRNTGTRTIHNVVVSAQIDPATAQFSTPLPFFGTITGETAFWEIPQLYSGNSWSVTVPLVLSKTAQQGTRATVTARVSADDLAGNNAGASLVSTTTVGVTGLPVTGMRFDVLFLIMSLLFTAFIAKKTVGRLATERA